MKSKQKKFYNKRYSIMRRALHKLQNVLVLFYDMRLIETVFEMLRVGSPDSVLEVGCGQGTDAILISRHAHQVVAIDVSSKAVKVATALSRIKCGSEKISFVVGDAEHLPFQKDLFDFVFFKDLLHHVSNSMSAMLEMKRVSRNAGKVVAIEANACNPEMILIGLIYYSVDRGVFRNTKSKLIAAFEQAGFSHISVVETEFLPRHILFEYRSPLCSISPAKFTRILPVVRKIENNLQNLAIIRKFANYLIIQGIKKV